MFKQDVMEVYEAVDQLLHDYDPQGLIKMGAPADEYYNEIPGIVHAALVAESLGDLQWRIYSVFKDWFGANSCGRPESYADLAEALWDRMAARREEREEQRAALRRAKAQK